MPERRPPERQGVKRGPGKEVVVQGRRERVLGALRLFSYPDDRLETAWKCMLTLTFLPEG